MQIIAVVSALFATSALAAPQWGGPRFQPGWNPGWNGNGRGGNPEGPYQNSCTCSQNGIQDQYTGQLACQQLGFSYPNLQWNGRGCIDRAGQGVEYNGFRRACEQVGGFGGFGWGGGVDAQCSNFF